MPFVLTVNSVEGRGNLAMPEGDYSIRAQRMARVMIYGPLLRACLFYLHFSELYKLHNTITTPIVVERANRT